MGGLDIADFYAAADDGLLNCVEDGPLRLFCYTQRCVYERVWTPTTLAARGIVFDDRDGRVVARPFPKFFNLGEPPGPSLAEIPAGLYFVEEKLDGSLGIVFWHEGRWRVCTKGSFTSEQARYAEQHLLPRLCMDRAAQTRTHLFEIIYPENRIVVDYEGDRGLHLLSAIETETGREEGWGNVRAIARELRCPVVYTHDGANVHNLQFPESGTAAEGYVIRFASGLRVKAKSPAYVRIARIIERCSPKRILEMVEAGTVEETRALIPDDLAGEFDDVLATLVTAIDSAESRARLIFEQTKHLLEVDRGTFARCVQTYKGAPLSLVFALADGKDIRPAGIKHVRKSLTPDTPAPPKGEEQ